MAADWPYVKHPKGDHHYLQLSGIIDALMPGSLSVSKRKESSDRRIRCTSIIEVIGRHRIGREVL
jgi:hypothetical protein